MDDVGTKRSLRIGKVCLYAICIFFIANLLVLATKQEFVLSDSVYDALAHVRGVSQNIKAALLAHDVERASHLRNVYGFLWSSSLICLVFCVGIIFWNMRQMQANSAAKIRANNIDIGKSRGGAIFSCFLSIIILLLVLFQQRCLRDCGLITNYNNSYESDIFIYLDFIKLSSFLIVFPLGFAGVIVLKAWKGLFHKGDV